MVRPAGVLGLPSAALAVWVQCEGGQGSDHMSTWTLTGVQTVLSLQQEELPRPRSLTTSRLGFC